MHGQAGSRILQCVENGDFLSESLLHDEISDAPAEFYNYVEKIESFTQHHDGCVRESAAFALGLIGDARAIDSLIKLLEDESLTDESFKDGSWEARVESAHALAKIGGQKARNAISNLIESHDNSVFVEELIRAMYTLREQFDE
jgi:HEAT repeat protein